MERGSLGGWAVSLAIAEGSGARWGNGWASLAWAGGRLGERMLAGWVVSLAWWVCEQRGAGRRGGESFVGDACVGAKITLNVLSRIC